jgi:transcription factor IIIB 90 kDa subunit
MPPRMGPSGRRPPRVPSLKNPASLQSSPAPPTKNLRRTIFACPGCNKPDIREDGGQAICFSCGIIVSDSIIVNDVTFGEAPSGAALVQGTTVHEGQRHAKSAGTSFRHGGRSPEEALQASLRAAKEEMTRLSNSLMISNLVDRAFRLYQIARVHHFHRPVLESVAICLYIVCRQTKGNTTLLIDFAEKIRINVFDLGSAYKKFVRAIGLEAQLENIPILEIEPLLYKFAKRLEFGSSTRQVANDAALILSRMERDWMVTGRQPPALCGSALILAARMNNFRRSVREVVYVVKAGDATIMKRLWEFRQTAAGQLTVSQFRQFGHRLKETNQPPAVYRAKMLERAQQITEEESRAGSEESNVATLGSPTPRLSEVPRRDEDGFVIPDRPTPRRRGRPRTQSFDADDRSEYTLSVADDENGDSAPKRKRRKKEPLTVMPFVLREEDLQAEDELERQIEDIITRDIYADDRYDSTLVRARAAAEVAKSRLSSALDNEVIGEDEFEDDPEVANCLLSAEEIEQKEKYWVSHNHEWLRLQQEIMLDKAMEEAAGKKKRQAKRKARSSSQADDTPASTPAEASHRMLEKKNIRPAFSRHINYEKLKKIYGLGDEDDANNSRSGTSSESRSTSLTPSRTAKPVEEIVIEDDEPAEEPDCGNDLEEEADPGANEYDDEEDYDNAESEEVDYDELGLEGNELDDDDDDY